MPLTIVISILLVLSAFGLIAIGYFLTGKMRVHIGACGRAPGKKKDKSCGKKSSCELCQGNKDEEDDVQQGKS
jgi:hypothetical protein